MIRLTKLDLLKRQRLSGVLGLALDGSRLDGVVLRRTNGAVHVQQTFSVSLSLDPLTNDPELVGREIRNHLDAVGIRERQCVVGLPLKWALTTHAEVPDLPEADVSSFLQLEAERGFPCDVQTLHVANSRFQSPSGKQHATLVGIPRNHLVALEQALRAAKLKPVSFSLGITALQPAGTEVSKGVFMPYSFGNALFQISGRFSNLQNLPFSASFDAANMFEGQNVYISTHATTVPGGFPYVLATTITMMPQTINGTVSAISSDGGFTTYTVALAPYDLIPALAVQPGQTTVLTNPSNVVVYVDGNTHLLNTKPLAVGNVVRFNGLLFNDNGTLRMDCGRVNDGVAE